MKKWYNVGDQIGIEVQNRKVTQRKGGKPLRERPFCRNSLTVSDVGGLVYGRRSRALSQSMWRAIMSSWLSKFISKSDSRHEVFFMAGSFLKNFPGLKK